MQDEQPSSNDVVQLPSPTVWPMVLALGISLLLAGMVTNPAIGLLGGSLVAAAALAGSSRYCPMKRMNLVSVQRGSGRDSKPPHTVEGLVCRRHAPQDPSGRDLQNHQPASRAESPAAPQ